MAIRDRRMKHEEQLFLPVDHTGQAAVRKVPIGRVPVRREPGDIGIRVEPHLSQHAVPLSESDHLPGESDYFLVFLRQPPVVPRCFVVLAVGVVVPLLRSSEFVPSQKKRYSPRNEESGYEVLDLAESRSLDLWIVRLSLRTVIIAVVLVRAVPSPLAVGFIMLFVIAHEVVEREAVVAGHEVDAVQRLFACPLIDVGAARDAARKDSYHARIATPEKADVVAEFSVPFRPAVARERPDLVEPGSVPCLRDELGVPQNGVFRDLGEKRGVRMNSPSSSRPMTEARSKRKPSTCISTTQ